MPVLRSEVMQSFEAVCASLGWVHANYSEDLATALKSDKYLNVAWRFMPTDTVHTAGGSGQPLQRIVTVTIEYKAMVVQTRDRQLNRWIAADVPDILAEAMLDRKGQMWTLQRQRVAPGRGSLFDIVPARDVQGPVSANAQTHMYGQIAYAFQVEIDARTSSELLALTAEPE